MTRRQAMTPIAQTIFEQLKAGGDLPSPKGTALYIIRLTRQDDVSLSDLAQAIKTDPVFAGRLIKAANGANRTGARPIASILDAITVLGVPAVRTLALGFSLLSAYRHGTCGNFDYERYWSHSLVSAIAMQALSTATRIAPPEDAFSIGLLCRIGEIALATLFPAKYSDLLGRRKEEPELSLLDLEQANFVMTHTLLSVSMMLDWGLPNSYVEPVSHYEALEAMPFEQGSPQWRMIYLLALSDYIADVCLAPPAQLRSLLPRLCLLGSQLSLDADAVTGICDKVVLEWQEWGAMLKVKAARLPPFNELFDQPGSASLATAGAAEGNDSENRMRILIVDDEASMRKLLRALLSKDGHEVLEAANGRQGFEMALESQPQIMIIDWLMPEMDGIELTKLLRETKVGQSIYILILTSFEDDDKLIQAFASGADDFMSKPLKPRVLAARLHAGQRIVMLQQAIRRDSEEIRRYAAELAVTNRRLQQMALTDSLTGCPNRRYAMERLQQEWAAGTRSKRPLSVMVIDVDSFKPINDTYGHDVGDGVLKRVAEVLKSGLRGQDVVCRVGGDEFLVISPDTSLEAASACAERVRLALHAARLKVGKLTLQGSISVGVAVRDDSMGDIDALIKCADQCVYHAKQQGRNRVAACQRQEPVG